MIGAGYVGLVSAACFSDFGWNVTCVEKDARKVHRLNSGEIPIYEPGLEALVSKNARAGRLHFTTELAAVARDADLIFLAVGTPMRRGDFLLSFVIMRALFVAVEVPVLFGFGWIAFGVRVFGSALLLLGYGFAEYTPTTGNAAGVRR